MSEIETELNRLGIVSHGGWPAPVESELGCVLRSPTLAAQISPAPPSRLPRAYINKSGSRAPTNGFCFREGTHSREGRT